MLVIPNPSHWSLEVRAYSTVVKWLVVHGLASIKFGELVYGSSHAAKILIRDIDEVSGVYEHRGRVKLRHEVKT